MEHEQGISFKIKRIHILRVKMVLRSLYRITEFSQRCVRVTINFYVYLLSLLRGKWFICIVVVCLLELFIFPCIDIWRSHFHPVHGACLQSDFNALFFGIHINTLN